jgi:hypothetical protein
MLVYTQLRTRRFTDDVGDGVADVALMPDELCTAISYVPHA